MSLGISGLELGDAGGHLTGNGTGELGEVGSESYGTELEDPVEVWIGGNGDVCTRRILEGEKVVEGWRGRASNKVGEVDVTGNVGQHAIRRRCCCHDRLDLHYPLRIVSNRIAPKLIASFMRRSAPGTRPY